MSNAKNIRRRTTQRAGHGRGTYRGPKADAQEKALARRLDALDEKIWAAARSTDDPHLAVRAARDFADRTFLGVILGAGSGQHRINCSVATNSGALTAPKTLPVSVMADVGTIALPETRADSEICELMALAHASAAPAVIVLRSTDLDGSPYDAADDVLIRGWQVAKGRCEPLDAAGIFAVCCSDPVGGDPLPIHPGTRYEDAYPLIRVPRPGYDDEERVNT